MKNKAPQPFKTYFGGKSGDGTYQTLINHIPPHKVYCSFFCGNDAVYRNMRRSVYALLMDLDPTVIDSWLDVGYFTDQTYHKIVCSDAFKALDDIKMAMEPFWFDYKLRLEEIFLFLDPPYMYSTRKSPRPVYKCELGLVPEHRVLLNSVKKLSRQGVKIMLCSYPNDLYDSELSGWNKVEYWSKIRGGVALEAIYMNYQLDGKLHDYRYLGGDFREREKFKRITMNLVAKLNRLEPGLRNKIVAELKSELSKMD